MNIATARPRAHVDGASRLPASRGLVARADADAKPWEALFSSLYLAELAAADQAEHAAATFERGNCVELAMFYRNMMHEERGHAHLVREMFDSFIAPPPVAYEVYGAKRCLAAGAAATIERLALVHLVFEPSALAFLSHISAAADTIFAEDWANVIRHSCRQILRDESAHVRVGRTTVASLLSSIDEPTRSLIRKSIRTHHAFLLAGMRRFFAGSRFAHLSTTLNERYKFAFANAVSGVINGVDP